MHEKESSDADSKASGETGAPAPRRRFRWLWLALAALVVASVAFRVALPPLLQRLLEDQVSGALPGRLEIGDVDLSLLRGEVVLDEAVFYDAAPERAPILSIAHATGKLKWRPLLDGRVHLEGLHLEAPELRVDFGPEGELNLTAFVPPEASTTESESGGPDDATFSFALDGASIANGVVRFRDARPASAPEATIRIGSFGLRELRLDHPPDPAADWDWSLATAEAGEWKVALGAEPDAALQIDVVARSEGSNSRGERFPVRVELSGEAGELTLEGSAQLAPLAADFTLGWQGLALEPIWQVLGGEGFEISRGSSRGELAIALDLAGGEARGLRVSGELEVSDGALRELRERGFEGTFEALAVEVAELRLALPEDGSPDAAPPPLFAHLARVRLEQPELSVSRALPVEPRDTPVDGAALALRIDRFEIARGGAKWLDPSLGSGFSFAVSGIEAEGRGLVWPAATLERASLEIASLGSTPLRVEAKRGAQKGALKLRAERVSLPAFNPYLTPASGYVVNRGTLSARADLELDGDRYAGPLALVFHRVEVDGEDRGGAFERTFGVPLDVAVMLLADYEGDISLDVPIDGEAQGTDPRFVPEIVSATRRSLVNALASPVKVLGSVLLPGWEERRMTVSVIPFRAGEGAPSELGRARVENLGSLLTGQSGFVAKLTPRITREDGRALAPELDWDDTSVDELAADHAVRAGLLDLAKRRLEAIRARLVEAGVAPAGIELRDWDGDVAQEPPAGVQLGLARPGA